MTRLEPVASDHGVTDHAGLKRWLASRPPEIKRLSAEFPAGSVVTLPEGDLYIIGHAEGDMVLVSDRWLFPDYHGSMAHKTRMHANHLRDGEVPIRLYQKVRKGVRV